MFDEKNEDSATRDSFIASRGWCGNFMRRHGFSLRRKTATAQKDPSFLVDRLVSYVMHVRRLQKRHTLQSASMRWMKLPCEMIWYQTPQWNQQEHGMFP